MVSAFDPHRPADTSRLGQRLENLRLALGADGLALARRSSTVADHRGTGPFEVLARVGPAAEEGPEVGIPVEVVHRLMREARPLDLLPGRSQGLGPALERWGAERVLGWALPPDRRPSVFAVAIYRGDRDPGPIRIRTALSGLEALARALAPPDWLPLAASRSSAGSAQAARCPLLLGSSRVAVELRREFGVLRPLAAPVLVEGLPGSGREALAEALVERDRPIARVEARDLIGETPVPGGLVVARGIESLSVTEQNCLRDALARGVADGGRWVFLAPPELRRAAETGSFRSDLYWRLAAHRIEVPPLSARREDLEEMLVELWHARTGRRVEVSAGAAACLREAPWPGHYQQLRGEVWRLVERHPRARQVQRRWLSSELRRGGSGDEVEAVESLGEAMERFERSLLQRALRVAEGNKSVAARQLRLSRQGLYRKLRQHGLLPADP